MKTTFFTLVCWLICSTCLAQIPAVTETGDAVVLYENGTWKYVNADAVASNEIPLNPKKFKRDKDATFLLKSNRLKLGFWLDPKVWSFEKATDNPTAEYEMEMKNGELYAMVIAERLEVPLETMRTIAYENGKEEAPDLQVVKEEYRMVNGLKVLFLQMDGTIQGIKFSYYGYYYSDEGGTVQYVVYTSQSLIHEYRKEADALLNGLVKID